VQDALSYLTQPPAASAALRHLSALLRRWFHQRHAGPTLGQRLCWPALTAGRHVLLSAPTGSGKTLAAFAPILDRLSHAPPAAGVQALYVAPLRSLCQDMLRTVRQCLRELDALRHDSRLPLRVALRSGDSSAAQRRRLWDEPPDLLLTTPESLTLLLSHPDAAGLFAPLRFVVVDEVHGLAAGKRGADLSVSLERLTALAAAPPVRVGLSATCAPLTEAARFLVGAGRGCDIALVQPAVTLDVRVEVLAGGASNFGLVAHVLERLEPELERWRCVLVFAPSRAVAERLLYQARRRWPAWAEALGVHHGSLSAARRRAVEEAVKLGRLRAVFCTGSLELGVDLPTVDQVVVVGGSGGVARLLQRIGRSGHEPGAVKRGLVLTRSTAELLEITVTAASARTAQWDPLRVPAHPLDVLCQQVLSLAAQNADGVHRAAALALVRRAWPFHGLSDADFNDCLDYLSGRDRAGRDWLPARLHWEGDRFHLADDRTLKLLRRNLGTILGEPTCVVRLADGPALGTLETTFVERLAPGNHFLLDGRALRYDRLEHETLWVEEVTARPLTARWRSDASPLSRTLAERLWLLRQQAAEALRHGGDALELLLRRDYGLTGAALETLAAFFAQQELVSEIPDLQTLLIEAVDHGLVAEYVVHTPLSRAANDALAWVLTRRLGGRRLQVLPADLGVTLALADGAVDEQQWRRLLAPEHFTEDLHAALADSELFRQRFERVARTGLMVLRNPLGRARRVGGAGWTQRRLLDVLRERDPEFVLLRQTRCELEQEGCDAEAAQAFLEQAARRTLRLRWLAAASPFAQALTQTDDAPAEVTATPAEALEQLQRQLLGGTG
jgi:ATP-dependent Lhr-like helicase